MSKSRYRNPDGHSQTVARNEVWAKLSPTDQLASLDSRLGKGVGAKKQRAKLQAKIARSK